MQGFKPIELKINDELRKLLQKDYSLKRSTCDRIVNKLKANTKAYSQEIIQTKEYIFQSNHNLNLLINSSLK